MTLDPDLAAIMLAGAFAGALALPRLWRRRVERFCRDCGRKIVSGIRTCDCDL